MNERHTEPTSESGVNIDGSVSLIGRRRPKDVEMLADGVWFRTQPLIVLKLPSFLRPNDDYHRADAPR